MAKQNLVKTKVKAGSDEQNLKNLKKRKKLLLSKLDKQQIELNMLKQEIKAFYSTNPGETFSGIFDELNTLIKETNFILLDCLKKPKLKRDERQHLKGLGEFIREQLEESEDFLKELKQETEEYTQKQKEAFEHMEENKKSLPSLDEFLNQLSPEISQEEKQNLRSLYIELARSCHPDKFSNNEDEDKYHNLMKEINLAYHSNDFARLVQIKESLFLEDNNSIIDEKPEEKTKRQIQELENEIPRLEDNLDRIKKQIKNIKKSELGESLKMRGGAFQFMFEGANFLKEEFQTIKMGLEDFQKTNIFPHYLFLEEEDDDDDEIPEDELIAHLFNNLTDEQLMEGLAKVMGIAADSESKEKTKKKTKKKKK